MSVYEELYDTQGTGNCMIGLLQSGSLVATRSLFLKARIISRFYKECILDYARF